MRRLTPIARTLRKTPTHAEKRIWWHLRLRQIEGLKFRRQLPIGNYIVDFVCLEKRLIIEIDGGQHAKEKEQDRERDDYLRSQGFEVLRFWNNEVLQNIEGVLERVREFCLGDSDGLAFDSTQISDRTSTPSSAPTSLLPRSGGEEEGGIGGRRWDRSGVWQRWS